ncbi:ferric reductase-like transmembrane domain-containing protein [Fodinisporobacter ferrooxydans]|uniref:Ferric reductase-like transmembrane domain-containing protein n=1 Tax=Fodinisporobacter ferrooxydans TaxID=2901836 RepID=A0ABY4CE52_9BACL|nr:ferric reductase-like transmembrane domain-containing protein [Alicyclobacillaceae bacterium MYW30-H2]
MDLLNTWYLTRAAGITSYVLLSLSVMSGLYGLVRKKHGQSPGIYPLLHTALANWAMYIAMFHVAILFFDQYTNFTWKDILVPFATTYKTIPMAIGIIGFYLLIATILTTEMRNKIGVKIWRKLHMLSPIVYIMVTLHGLWIGTDSKTTGSFGMYVISIFGVLLLLFLRFKRSRQQVLKYPRGTMN